MRVVRGGEDRGPRHEHVGSCPGGKTTDAKLTSLGLTPRSKFYYLFDFGDEWWHRIRVESITQTAGKRKSIKVVKSVGESPPQYEDEEDEDDDEEDEDEE